ncbi:MULTISPECIES: hypothetical protein [Gordonia]|jgi:hypothetical protein|uniref:hypothetical protein n=1 Tax=Gordonia TaxID=2053 RepID=UPI003016949A
MRNRTRVIAGTIVAAGLAGASLSAVGGAAADGFPGGPYCRGPAKVMAESALSQVVICPVQGPTGWGYSGKAKTTGNWIDVNGATQDQFGRFHAYNNGYTYHVHREYLHITAPDGTTVSYEPWTFYTQR